MRFKVMSRLKRTVCVLFSSNSVAPREEEDEVPDPIIERVKELASENGLKINLGCGTDYRDGWLNIDGSTCLPKIDRVLRVPEEALDGALGAGVADYILANDVVEHVRHWEGVKMLRQMYLTLKPGGGVEIRVPDCAHILANDMWSIEEKLVLLFGGQDIPQGRDAEMDASRVHYPEFFCHAFGWTKERMRQDLRAAGFKRCAFRRAESNFVAYAIKSE